MHIMHIEDEELAIDCPCGARLRFTVRDAWRSVEVACLECGETSRVHPEDHPELEDIQREMDEYLPG